MKNLKVVLEPFFIKGDVDDQEQLQQDILEKVATMVEDETLKWSLAEDEDEDEDS